MLRIFSSPTLKSSEAGDCTASLGYLLPCPASSWGEIITSYPLQTSHYLLSHCHALLWRAWLCLLNPSASLQAPWAAVEYLKLSLPLDEPVLFPTASPYRAGSPALTITVVSLDVTPVYSGLSWTGSHKTEHLPPCRGSPFPGQSFLFVLVDYGMAPDGPFLQPDWVCLGGKPRFGVTCRHDGIDDSVTSSRSLMKMSLRYSNSYWFAGRVWPLNHYPWSLIIQADFCLS